METYRPHNYLPKETQETVKVSNYYSLDPYVKLNKLEETSRQTWAEVGDVARTSTTEEGDHSILNDNPAPTEIVAFKL